MTGKPNRPRLRGAWGLLLLTALVGLGGCESIAGIEDRTLDPSGSAGGELCKSYCAVVMDACTGERAVYASQDTCLATCAALPAGSEGDTNQNTVQCRVRQAKFAKSTGEPAVHCPNAGPGGNGACGTNCESYCTLFEKACPDDAELVANCPASCLGIKDAGFFDVELQHGGDTLQCRLVHTSSALVNPEVHCGHAQLAPLAGEWCTDPVDVLPKCEDYCRLEAANCTGENAVYEDQAQCMKACASFDVGLSTDTTQDTLGCRKYHTYNSIAAPEIHCAHSGVGGDGHCGATNCPGYCKLLADTCDAEFTAAFGDQGSCESACASVSGSAKDSGFSVVGDDGPTYGCRLRHLLRATANKAECDAAVGNGVCQ